MGHSMGGFMAAWAARDPRVAGLIMVSAWDIGPDVAKGSSALPAPDKGVTENAARLAGTSSAQLWKEASAHAQDWNLISLVPQLKSKPALVIEADDHSLSSNHAMFVALQKAGDTDAREFHIATDHLYSDSRIALESEIIRWLEQFGH